MIWYVTSEVTIMGELFSTLLTYFRFLAAVNHYVTSKVTRPSERFCTLLVLSTMNEHVMDAASQWEAGLLTVRTEATIVAAFGGFQLESELDSLFTHLTCHIIP